MPDAVRKFTDKDFCVNNKTCCLTLDMESDHGYLNQDCFDLISKRAEEIIDFFSSLDVRITVFVTGDILAKHQEFLKDFQEKTGSEIELHSYSHHTKDLTEEVEIVKSLKIYKKIFGCSPKGYRTPYGKVGVHTADILKEKGFIYHSSVFIPENVAYYGDEIYKYRSDLVELPVSRTLRIPYGQGFVNFFGRFFPHAFFYGKDLLVEYMHIHDFFYSAEVEKLPWYFRVFYIRKQKNPKAARDELFDRVRKLKAMGYKFETVANFIEDHYK